MTNFTGTEFTVGIERGVRLLSPSDAEKQFGLKLGEGVGMVGYETDNRITNRGEDAWVPETGLLSIWFAWDVQSLSDDDRGHSFRGG